LCLGPAGLKVIWALGKCSPGRTRCPLAQLTIKRTARAWQYREQLREILDRKQINIVTHPASTMVHERAALQGRVHEGGRPHDPQAY
jgi:hypothetical protein